MNGILSKLLRRRETPVPRPGICGKADQKTWLNPRIKLRIDQRRWSSDRPPTLIWHMLVWSQGEWQHAGYGQGKIEEAFNYMKEISAHSQVSSDDALFWSIRCGGLWSK